METPTKKYLVAAQTLWALPTTLATLTLEGAENYAKSLVAGSPSSKYLILEVVASVQRETPPTPPVVVTPFVPTT